MSNEFKWVMLSSKELKKALVHCAIACGWKYWHYSRETETAYAADPVLFLRPDSGEIGLAQTHSTVRDGEGISMDSFLTYIQNEPPKPSPVNVNLLSGEVIFQCFPNGCLRVTVDGCSRFLSASETSEIFNAYKQVNKIP